MRGINQEIEEEEIDPTNYSNNGYQRYLDGEDDEYRKIFREEGFDALREALLLNGIDAQAAEDARLAGQLAREGEESDKAADAQWELDRYIPERDGA